MKKLILALFLCSTAGLSLAIDTGQAFEDPEMQARYEKIISEVRCLKCQNQTIKDSNAFLAGDLRREIRRLMTDGKTDAEIFDFLVERYGDFALYRPRMSGVTLLLWIAPGIFLLAGAFVAVRVVRKRMSMPIGLDDETDQAVS